MWEQLRKAAETTGNIVTYPKRHPWQTAIVLGVLGEIALATASVVFTGTEHNRFYPVNFAILNFLVLWGLLVIRDRYLTRQITNLQATLEAEKRKSADQLALKTTSAAKASRELQQIIDKQQKQIENLKEALKTEKMLREAAEGDRHF